MTFTETLFGRKNTIRTYASLFKTHIEPIVNENSCKGWTEFDTQNIIKKWEINGLSRNTQTSLLRVLSKFIQYNSGPKIDTSKYIRLLSRSEQQKDITVLNINQSKKLMSNCAKHDPEFYPILLLALHAGLRRGEVYGLKCKDIDYIKMRVKVERSYDGPTKNGKTRFVPMSNHLADAVTKWALNKKTSDRLFKLEDPNPRLKNLCTISELPRINFHALRHTYATLALESGVSPKKVQKWLGHAALTTTLNIYWGINNYEEESLDFLPGGNG